MINEFKKLVKGINYKALVEEIKKSDKVWCKGIMRTLISGKEKPYLHETIFFTIDKGGEENTVELLDEYGYDNVINFLEIINKHIELEELKIWIRQ